jgi:hypothetical protein
MNLGIEDFQFNLLVAMIGAESEVKRLEKNQSRLGQGKLKARLYGR